MKLPLYVSPDSFAVAGIVLKSLMRFELIFVRDVHSLEYSVYLTLFTEEVVLSSRGAPGASVQNHLA